MNSCLSRLNRGLAAMIGLLGTIGLCGCDGVPDLPSAPGPLVDPPAKVDGGSEGGCQPPPAGVPAAIAAPTDECVKAITQGTGVQIYTCTADANGASYQLLAPEASLRDSQGQYQGNHFLGPAWQWRDGSKIHGVKIASAPAPDPGAVAWLLLQVQSEDGAGALADVLHVQRLSTSGGVAPATGCDAGTVGTQVRVPYQAEYVFYRSRPGPGTR